MASRLLRSLTWQQCVERRQSPALAVCCFFVGALFASALLHLVCTLARPAKTHCSVVVVGFHLGCRWLSFGKQGSCGTVSSLWGESSVGRFLVLSSPAFCRHLRLVVFGVAHRRFLLSRGLLLTAVRVVHGFFSGSASSLHVARYGEPLCLIVGVANAWSVDSRPWWRCLAFCWVVTVRLSALDNVLHRCTWLRW
jgi:hypothetical protein